jgi:predicted homoserine dehydrogenase-like protein
VNLHRRLLARAAQGAPVRVGVIGCGKFASMFLAQAPRTQRRLRVRQKS